MRFDSRRTTVHATNGMVAASQPLAAMAGLRILMDGGNAVDAAVATAATLNVVEPRSTGVGGDVFALVWMSDEKQVRALNASGRSSHQASIEEVRAKGLTSIPPTSPYAVTVPGAVSGWETILESYGMMGLADVLKPAIEYALKGYPASETISDQWSGAVEKLKARPSGDELLVSGRAPKAGEFVVLSELGQTLQAIAEGGSEAFYRGPLAEDLTQFVQSVGGWLTMKDMAGHTSEWVEPISTEYRGVTCWECPPNSQGLNALMALNLVEGFDLPGMGFQSAAAYHHQIEAVKLAFADALHYITDPEMVDIPTEKLLSKQYADRRRHLIQSGRALGTTGHGEPVAAGDTVYLTAVDNKGNACSFINSLFQGFGTGLVVPGTGVALQNRGSFFSLDPDHANALAPNKRTFHTLIPGMATRDGELWLSYGVMGALQQAQGHLQVIVNMVDFGLDPQSALDAPRFSVVPGNGVAIEDLVPDETVRDLRKLGHDVSVLPPGIAPFGGGQIIERDPETGVLKGASEPRMDGYPAGW